MKDKFLITILFWERDKAQAMKLARLLADLEPEHCKTADILFVARFDCKQDKETVEYVSRKFNVYTYTSTRRGVGWPMGCNSIFFGAMEHIYHKIASGKFPHYKSVFLLAADSAPIHKDWLARLHFTWDLAVEHRKVHVAGAWIPGEREHINGDCMLFSGDLKFLKWLAIDVQDIPNRGGWDWLLGDKFRQWGWADFPSIKSLWRKPSFSQEEWESFRKLGVDWIHGIKTDDVLELSRKNLL
jgi:hypothetical protein